MSITTPLPPALIPPPASWYEIPAGTPLHRVWNQKRAANAFNARHDIKPTRFAPIRDAKGHVIPTLYAAITQECAFYERIFHEVPLQPTAERTIHVGKLQGETAGTIVPTRTLRLVRLHEPDLRRLGLGKAQLVHTDADHYPLTARWAEAFHRSFDEADGLIWTSNRCDPDLALVLFGDRCADALPDSTDGELIEDSDALLKVFNDCAERAGIDVVSS